MLVGHSISDAFGRILAVDHGICELLHRPEAELIGMSYKQITHPDDVTWNASLVDKLKASGGPLAIRKRYLRPGAPAIWSDVQVSRLRDGLDQGRLVGTISKVELEAIELSPAFLWRSANRKERDLRARRTELGDDLFADYPWLILLQLYKAEAEGVCISLIQLSRHTGCREQTLVRWLKALVERELIDFFDSDICVGQLTSTGMSKIEGLLEVSLDI
ncbi:hypothetical protein C8J46_109103 [Sphingomonas sp. PP-F2F-A104-K0414]|uniref:PAS domain-containing protein n=1 Tax=Sphingomonas sp. PP-F2F-A104-K0414 TaxID=2135661 RepID=UPI0010484CA5|nr:PAS domain-containing protein [Sphingomonas sp. PP-F2F-A104-K0414]TCP96407.1 hypothetical protein C8J46_109103 [Sphingomonas sp. PP-F2F-A104-K0414]